MIPTRMPQSVTSAPASSSLAGFGYLIAVAPMFRAAAAPASDEPETNTPGNRSGASGGVNFSLSTR